MKFDGFILDMDDQTYNITPTGYVDIVRYFVNALTSLKGDIMGIVQDNGLDDWYD